LVGAATARRARSIEMTHAMSHLRAPASHSQALLFGLIALAAAVALGFAPARAGAAECERDVSNNGEGDPPGALLGAGTLWETQSNTGQFEDAMLLDGGNGLSRGDAFDDYGRPFVNGGGYFTSSTQGCKRVNGGHGVRYPTETMGDLKVTPTLYVDQRRPFGRQLVMLKSTANVAETYSISIQGDLGSDSETKVARSSSGNATVNAGDAWATTCEDLDGDGCGDAKGEPFRSPELVHSWQRQGKAREKADVVSLVSTSEGFETEFLEVKVGAGKTVALLHVVSLHKNIKRANEAAAKIGKDPAGYGVFRGLNDTQRKRILNW
jgi:hypothetical protein